MDNKFGKISRISACAALKDGKTILEDLSFTAPYKIMMPFEKENGGIQIMPLCASAGIMAGDSQEFSYHVKEGADLEVLSQSFEKIHKMDTMNAFSTADFPQKSCCTEGTNSSIATIPAMNRTKCPWKESECTRVTHIWQTCFFLKSAAEMVKIAVRNPGV